MKKTNMPQRILQDQQQDKHKVVCAFCKGSGEHLPSFRIACSACQGKGVKEFTEPMKQCPLCKGTGRGDSISILTCRCCGGLGVIAEKSNKKMKGKEVKKERFRELGKRLKCIKKIKERINQIRKKR